ncbi:hypothetical protein BDV23DRAFT_177162 [Aspergillus alliaceus]|uniref:Uncharacterized protein n=1 Tax=Petromyces alliaceus TaxID=209559 RepID=A0A5N7BR39_PETAA|nr:hypothetical protein BDV23DRAFT_177162 [Aspergillus alliaceus]
MSRVEFIQAQANLELDCDLAEEQEEDQSQALDWACLDFSITLLDYFLKGNLFESTVVGFLAVLGMDTAKQTFHKPYRYTGYLSGLIADKGKIAYLTDALDAI